MLSSIKSKILYCLVLFPATAASQSYTVVDLPIPQVLLDRDCLPVRFTNAEEVIWECNSGLEFYKTTEAGTELFKTFGARYLQSASWFDATNFVMTTFDARIQEARISRCNAECQTLNIAPGNPCMVGQDDQTEFLDRKQNVSSSGDILISCLFRRNDSGSYTVGHLFIPAGDDGSGASYVELDHKSRKDLTSPMEVKLNNAGQFTHSFYVNEKRYSGFWNGAKFSPLPKSRTEDFWPQILSDSGTIYGKLRDATKQNHFMRVNQSGAMDVKLVGSRTANWIPKGKVAVQLGVGVDNIALLNVPIGPTLKQSIVQVDGLRAKIINLDTKLGIGDRDYLNVSNDCGSTFTLAYEKGAKYGKGIHGLILRKAGC